MDRDLIVIGGGAAGATCAIFAARLGLNTAVVDRMGVGGQLINLHSVKDYPGFADGVAGWDLAASLSEHMMNEGVGLEFGSVEGISSASEGWQVDVDGTPHRAPAVVIATGATPRPLLGDDEERFAGHGISYCATCDGPLFQKQDVAVIGGGDSGMSEASYLAGVAGQVFVLFQEPEPPAAKAWTSEAQGHANVRFMPATRFTGVVGDSEVAGIRYERLNGGGGGEVAVQGVFGCTGLVPNSELFRDVAKLDAAGFVVTDAALACPATGLFAAGDVRAGASMQLAGAVGEGAQAALSVRKFLQGK